MMANPDFKAMYYHLAGRMAVAVDAMDVAVDTLAATTKALEATTQSLHVLTQKLKLAQQATEEMFIGTEDGDLE